jgi:hypothetical protein
LLFDQYNAAAVSGINCGQAPVLMTKDNGLEIIGSIQK